jgi:hypothetical protein
LGTAQTSEQFGKYSHSIGALIMGLKEPIIKRASVITAQIRSRIEPWIASKWVASGSRIGSVKRVFLARRQRKEQMRQQPKIATVSSQACGIPVSNSTGKQFILSMH